MNELQENYFEELQENYFEDEEFGEKVEFKELETIWFEPKEEAYKEFGEQVELAIKQGKIERPKFILPSSYMSVSQVECYLTCPRKYEKKYVERIKSRIHIALAQGSAVHKGVEAGYLAKMAGKPVELEEVESAYSDTLTKSVEGGLKVDQKELGETTDQGHALLRKWYQSVLPTIQPVKVEAPFVTSVAGVPMAGIIDLIHETSGEQVVADNKVVGRKTPQTDADSSLQLTLYSGVTKIPKQELHLFVKTKVPKLDKVSTKREPRDLNWLTELVPSVAEAIQVGSFPPCSPSSWVCSEKWCDYWSICRGK